MVKNPYQLRVKDLMSRDVVTVAPQDSLHDTLQLMVENRVAAVPVVDHRSRCLGMLSTSDLMEVTRELDSELCDLENADLGGHRWLLEKLHDGVGNERVVDYMTENVASIDAESLLSRAAREMLKNRVHRLPVTDSKQRLVGIISTTDVLRAFVEGCSEEPELPKKTASA